MGSLGRKETDQVEQMAYAHEEIRAEIRLIENQLELYAQSQAIKPKDAVKTSLFDKIDKVEKVNNFNDAVFQSNNKIIPINSAKKHFNTYSIAASITFVLISAGIAFYYYSQLGKAKQQIISLETDRSVLASNVQSVNQKFTATKVELDNYLAFINDTSTKNVHLAGLPISTQSQANIYWKKTSAEVYIHVNSLPAPPTDMQYQLWAIADGKPIDAGVFEITDSLVLQKMKSINLAHAFAVTLEKKGGSIAPNMEAMYLLGNVLN